MISTPDVHVTKTSGYISPDPSTSHADIIDLCETGIVPELEAAIEVIFQDYLDIINLLCHTPRSNEVGKRRIRRAVAAAAEGWSPAEYAALSEDGKDLVVKKVLGDRQPNDGEWPSLLFYLGDGMAGTGEMKLCELAAHDLSSTSEWWSPCWNDDSLRWPTDFAWTARCPSGQTGYLYLCGGYAVHLAKHSVDQQKPILVHARIAMLHELVHHLRSFLHGRNSNNCTPEKCVDTTNGPEAGSGVGEGGRCFEQIAFGSVVDLFSGIQGSRLLTKDYDSKNEPVYEISRQLSRKLLDPADERPPINLPSQGSPAMPLFQFPSSSSFPLIKHKNSSKLSTANPTIPVSPRTSSLQNTVAHTGLIPLTGEFMERVQAFYKSREDVRRLRARQKGAKKIIAN